MKSNRTHYKHVHLALSGEIVNELNNVICSCQCDDNPSVINAGNAAFIMDVLNNWDALAEELAKLRADNARLREAVMDAIGILYGITFNHDHGCTCAACGADNRLREIVEHEWRKKESDKARAALATEKATAATEGNIPSLDTPEPSK